MARAVEGADIPIEDEAGILWARIIGSDENDKEILFTNPLMFMKRSFVSAIEKNLSEHYHRYRVVNEKEEDTASRYSKGNFLFWLEGIGSQKLLKIHPAMKDLPWVQQAMDARHGVCRKELRSRGANSHLYLVQDTRLAAGTGAIQGFG